VHAVRGWHLRGELGRHDVLAVHVRRDIRRGSERLRLPCGNDGNERSVYALCGGAVRDEFGFSDVHGLHGRYPLERGIDVVHGLRPWNFLGHGLGDVFAVRAWNRGAERGLCAVFPMSVWPDPERHRDRVRGSPMPRNALALRDCLR
jgi:hypothetical protein